MTLLAVALRVAVPVCIADLNALPEHLRDQTAAHWRAEAAEVLPAGGDEILYKGRETAHRFAVLARGIAVLAGAPGGVTAFGTMWCSTHHPLGVAVPHHTVCDDCADNYVAPPPAIITTAAL